MFLVFGGHAHSEFCLGRCRFRINQHECFPVEIAIVQVGNQEKQFNDKLQETCGKRHSEWKLGASAWYSCFLKTINTHAFQRNSCAHSITVVTRSFRAGSEFGHMGGLTKSPTTPGERTKCPMSGGTSHSDRGCGKDIPTPHGHHERRPRINQTSPKLSMCSWSTRRT